MITSAIAASAHVEMGRERFAEAKNVIAQGLTLDPTITELLEIRLVSEHAIVKEKSLGWVFMDRS